MLREPAVKLTLPFLVLMGLFNFFGCNKPQQNTTTPTTPKQSSLKTVIYRGGVVTFRIPANWHEEYEAEGGGMFYDETPDSSTLRLNVVTAQSPNPVTKASAPDILSGLRQTTKGVERLPTGVALIHYTESTEESGQRLQMTFWIIANVIPPNHVRIATFTYTILDSQKSDLKFQRELELLDREIRAAVFSPQLGVAPK
jgi:hypothetical protein